MGSAKQELLRKRMLCAIHTHTQYKVIKAAGAWEDWLTLRYGVQSCKFLNTTELGEVLDILNQKVPDRAFVQRSGSITEAQKAKIESMMALRGFTKEGKVRFITHQLGVYKPLWLLEREQASKIIIGLQKLMEER